MEQLAPDMRSLLRELQRTLNEGLRNQHGMTETGGHPRYYLDYVHVTEANALAFEHEDIAFIGITVPLLLALWQTCEQLCTTPDVTARFSLRPTLKEQQLLLAELFGCVLTFVVEHEYGHHRLGHRRQQNLDNPFWQEAIDLTTTGSIEDQAREVHADGFAVYLGLHHLILVGDRRERTLQHLGPPATTVYEALLWLFILAVASFFFTRPATPFDAQRLEHLTHPPQAARMNYVMHNVTRWCTQNRLTLLPAITLPLFQQLMRAVEAATWGNNAPAWLDQTTYFQSPEGAEYFTRLAAALDQPWNSHRRSYSTRLITRGRKSTEERMGTSSE